MKKWQVGLLVCAALVASISAYVLVQARSLEVERLSEDLFVLRGLGGNTAVLRTDAGAVVVDSMTLQMQDFARMCGKRRLQDLSFEDLATTSYEIAMATPVPHV